MTRLDAMRHLKQMKVRRTGLVDHIADCLYPSTETLEELNAVEEEIDFIMDHHRISQSDFNKWVQEDHAARNPPLSVESALARMNEVFGSKS